MAGPARLPVTGAPLFRPCGLRATGARCQMLPGVAFDRTADLYHVKADWPHQDTRGRSNFSGMLVQKATVIALRIGQLVNKTNPSNGSVAPK